MYRIGRASTVPVPCSYGVGLGVLFASRSLIVTASFNICRLGYAVVSGPRETGRLRTLRGQYSGVCLSLNMMFGVPRVVSGPIECI